MITIYLQVSLLSTCVSGRDRAMNLELFEELAEAIFSNWNAESFDESLLVPVGVTKPEFYRY